MKKHSRRCKISNISFSVAWCWSVLKKRRVHMKCCMFNVQRVNWLHLNRFQCQSSRNSEFKMSHGIRVSIKISLLKPNGIFRKKCFESQLRSEPIKDGIILTMKFSKEKIYCRFSIICFRNFNRKFSPFSLVFRLSFKRTTIQTENCISIVVLWMVNGTKNSFPSAVPIKVCTVFIIVRFHPTAIHFHVTKV